MAKAEYLIMGAGAVSIAGGIAEEGGIPSDIGKSLIATAALTLGASIADRSRIAPIVTALAWLMLLAAVFSAVPALQRNAGKKSGQVKVPKNAGQGTPRNQFIAAHGR